MKYLFLCTISAVTSAFASQIFFMELEDDFWMSDNIFLARVEKVSEVFMEYREGREYTLSVIEVIACSDSLGETITGTYTMDIPRAYITSSGEEVWESPIVNGSGMEMMVAPGDTVVVLSGRVPAGSPSEPVWIIRLESQENLPAVRELLQ